MPATEAGAEARAALVAQFQPEADKEIGRFNRTSLAQEVEESYREPAAESPPVEAASESTPPAPEEKPTPPPQPESVDAQVAKALAADRELQAARAEVERLKASTPAAIEKAVKERLEAEKAALLAKARRDPANFYRELGVTKLGDVGNRLYAADLGDDAPANLKEYVAQQERDNAILARIDEVHAENKALQEKLAGYEEMAKTRHYETTLEAHALSLPATEATAKAYPLLSHVAKTNPKRAAELVRNASQAHTNALKAAGETGEPLSAEAAAQSAEQFLAAVASLLPPPPAPAAPAKTSTTPRAISAASAQSAHRPNGRIPNVHVAHRVDPRDAVKKSAREAAERIFNNATGVPTK